VTLVRAFALPGTPVYHRFHKGDNVRGSILGLTVKLLLLLALIPVSVQAKETELVGGMFIGTAMILSLMPLLLRFVETGE
jgi:hypothetical protein